MSVSNTVMYLFERAPSGCLRRLSISFVLAAALALTGCDEDDFGDRAMKFVNEEVHGISRAHVEAELDNIVAQAFADSLVQLDADAKYAAALAQDFSTASVTIDPETVTNAELLTEFNKLDAQIATIFRLISRLEGNVSVVGQLDKVCTDNSIYYTLGLSDLGAQGPVLVATAALHEQKADWSVSSAGGGDTPWYVTVGIAVVNAFGANKTIEQNTTLKEAISLVGTKVLHEPEIRDIYRKRCGQMLDELRPQFASLGLLSDLTRKSLLETLSSAQASMAIVAAILRTRDINAFLASSGVTEQMSQAQNLIMQGELWTEILIQLQELRGRTAKIREKPECADVLTSIENYSDELREFKVQLTVLKPDVSSIPELPAKLESAAQEADNLLAGVYREYDWARSTVCH
jgi:hypothetical protein